MRVQLDRFEDGGWAVVTLLPEGRRSFDLPRETLPPGAAPGEVFEMKFERDGEEARKIASENGRLMEELLKRRDGE